MSTTKVSPLDAMRAARDWAECLPLHLRSTWIILATFYPNIFPEQETIASLTSVSRATVTRRLAELERLGAISTERRYVRAAGVTKRRSWRTLHLPELGTSPADELPDWVMPASFPELRCKAHPAPSTEAARMRRHLNAT
jgi:DNA-binding transcriptional MocR family regulator